jgi:hypothetical protein
LTIKTVVLIKKHKRAKIMCDLTTS